MKTLFVLAFLSSGLLASPFGCETGTSGHPLRFRGEFTIPTAVHPKCKDVFAIKMYLAQHFRVGPTGRTSVLNFQTYDGHGFLHNHSFVGLLGPDCEFLADKQIGAFHVTSEGFVSRDVVFSKVTAVLTEAGAEVCRVSAEYTGFEY